MNVSKYFKKTATPTLKVLYVYTRLHHCYLYKMKALLLPSVH